MNRSRRKTTHVKGIGGVFIRAKNPEKLSDWYRKNLGIKITDNIALFVWKSPRGTLAHSVWALFPKDSKYFPRNKSLMINYRVRNLSKTLQDLRRNHVRTVKKIEQSKFGSFGWIYDPEGNKIELWQPPRVQRYPEEANYME